MSSSFAQLRFLRSQSLQFTVCLSELPQNTPRLREAVALNSAAGAVSVSALDWCAPAPEALTRERWDVLLAADCVFWAALFDPLLDTLRALAHEGHTRIFLAIGERLGSHGPLSSFAQSAQRKGWELRELTTGSGPREAHHRVVLCELLLVLRPGSASSLDVTRAEPGGLADGPGVT